VRRAGKTPQREDDDAGHDWLGRASQVIPYVGGASALVLVSGYVVGFLVVNNYLAGYGVREVEPVRARYLAAAVPFAMMIVLTVVGGLELEKWVRSNLMRNLRPGLRRTLAAYLGLALIVLGSTALNVGLLLYLGQIPTTSFGDAAIYLATVTVFSGAILLAASNLRGRRGRWRSWLASNSFLGSVGALTLAVGAYATSIYPRVATWVGGGRPEDVELAVESSVASLCAPCAAGETVKLIDAEPSRIVVLITDARGTRAIEISRSEVHAISHKPKVPARP
jgi:hypothetical protein